MKSTLGRLNRKPTGLLAVLSIFDAGPLAPRLPRVLRLVCPIVLFLVFGRAQCLFAQDAMNGMQPFGSYEIDKFNIVNLENLNFLFTIPIDSIAARRLNTDVSLHFNQSIWRLAQDPNSPSGFSWQLAEGLVNSRQTVAPGWNLGQVIPWVRYSFEIVTCYVHGTPDTYERYSNYVLIESDGTTHPVVNLQVVANSPGPSGGNCPNNTVGIKSGYADNGFRIDLPVDSSGNTVPTNPTAYSRSGVRINSSYTGDRPFLQMGSIEDVNGNLLSSVNVSPTEVDWIDSLGRTIIKISIVLQNSLPTQYQYQTPNTSGGYNTRTIALNNLVIQTNFGCPQGYKEGQAYAMLPTSVTMANGKQYTFTYETTPSHASTKTGRLDTVILPTGGSYSYSYPGPNDGVTCILESVDNAFQHPDQTNGLIRSISGASSSLTQTYSWQRIDSQNVQTTITAVAVPADPNVSAKRVISAKRSQLPNPPFTVVDVITDQTYDSSSTNVVRTIVDTKAAALGRYPISKVTILEDGKTQTGSDYTYTGNGLLSDQTDYDFGNGANGAALRSEHLTYLGGSPYASKNILDRVTDRTITNAAGSVVFFRTHTDYDEYSFTTCPPGVPGHDDSVLCTDLTRGNPTSLTRYIDAATPAGAIVRHSYYDWFGNLVQADVDCCTQQTRNFSATTQYGYPDSVVMGPSGGPQLTTKTTYNFPTGLTASRTDENGNPTSYNYNDPLNRLTHVALPDGGSTDYQYDDTKLVVKQPKAIDNGVSPVTMESAYDALGQLIQTRLTSDPQGTDFTDFTYDALGRRIAQRLRPHQQQGPHS